MNMWVDSSDWRRDSGAEKTLGGVLARFYYALRPSIPRSLQILLRRCWCRLLRRRYQAIWPIDPNAGTPPENWPGWPGDKQFGLLLTHDVDTLRGLKRCRQLAQLELDLGFRSSFNFVPERYPLDASVRRDLSARGFEIGVHGLHHDGKLFASRAVFEARARRINDYLKAWNAVGFRAPAMHHNLEWQRLLAIEYDLSTFDSDPFEPQPDGVGTIFPFWVGTPGSRHGYLEMPYTLAQDFTLFVLLGQRDIELWWRKLNWIADCGGLALVNVHPDYLAFAGDPIGLETYSADLYRGFLERVRAEYGGRYWHGLPRAIAPYLLHSRYGHRA